MPGYNWSRGMSNNAVTAYANGKVPKSKLSAWQRRAVEAGAVGPCEWHHSSKYFNKVDFYDLTDFMSLKAADFPPVKKAKKEKLFGVRVAYSTRMYKNHEVIQYRESVHYPDSFLSLHSTREDAIKEAERLDTCEQARKYIALAENIAPQNRKLPRLPIFALC